MPRKDDMAEEPKSRVTTFPFWLYMDSSIPISKAWEFEFQSTRTRVYAPFRTASANWWPAPHINLKTIPKAGWKLPNGEQYKMDLNIVLPGLDGDNTQQTLFLIDRESFDSLPNPSPMDSLRIDIFGPTASDQFEKITKLILDWTRTLTGQWWVGTTPKGLIPYKSQIGFSINSDGTPSGPPGKVSDINWGLLEGERPLDLELWETTLEKISREELVPIDDSLYLDAKQNLASGDYRRFVIDLASSCEIKKDETARSLWESKHQETFDRNKILGNWSLPKHLDTKFMTNFGRSYKAEFPSKWQIINNLWDARGNVSHGKTCTYGDGKPVDRSTGLEFLRAVSHCRDWLRDLSI